MEGPIECFDTLICSGARRLTGYQRRSFMAEVTTELCKGSARQAERRFGWGRETVLKGLHESRQGIRCLENFAARGRLRSEEKDPQLAADIRAIVEPHTYADPQLKSSRRYTNLSAAEDARGLDRHGPSLRKVGTSGSEPRGLTSHKKARERRIVGSLKPFRWNPAGNQSRPVEPDQQPEASLAWWVGDHPCEA